MRRHRAAERSRISTGLQECGNRLEPLFDGRRRVDTPSDMTDPSTVDATRPAITAGPLLLGPLIRHIGHDDNWPMLADDAARSGGTPTELRPPFERKWYRLFADEGLIERHSADHR